MCMEGADFLYNQSLYILIVILIREAHKKGEVVVPAGGETD